MNPCYEYYVLERPISPIPIEDMNMIGAQGWEMFFYHASAACYRYFFRRVIKEE